MIVTTATIILYIFHWGRVTMTQRVIGNLRDVTAVSNNRVLYCTYITYTRT